MQSKIKNEFLTFDLFWKLSGAPRELPGRAPRDYRGLPGPGAPQASQGLPGVPKFSKGIPGVPRTRKVWGTWPNCSLDIRCGLPCRADPARVNKGGPPLVSKGHVAKEGWPSLTSLRYLKRLPLGFGFCASLAPGSPRSPYAKGIMKTYI